MHKIEIRPCYVICGKSKLAHSHPGNIRFRYIVQKYRVEYQSTSLRTEKGTITRTILAMIASFGGRFVRCADHSMDETCWEQLDDDEMYEKVSHALRSAKELKRSRKVKEALMINTPPASEPLQQLTTPVAQMPCIEHPNIDHPKVNHPVIRDASSEILSQPLEIEYERFDNDIISLLDDIFENNE